MKFTLEIKLGNKAMQSYADVSALIQDTSRRVASGSFLMNAEPKDGDGGKLRDANGNAVGKWEMIEEPAGKHWSTPQEFIAELRLRAWQERAAAGVGRTNKEKTARAEHAARALENLAADIERQSETYRCKGCGREESVCSSDPCPGVIADRVA